MGERAWLVLIHLLQPGRRFGVLAAESPELVHGPPDEVLVDAPCQETQLGAVEGSVIVDPALDPGIDFPGQAGQVCAAAAVEVPVPDLLSFRLLRLGADPATFYIASLPFQDATQNGSSGESSAPRLVTSVWHADQAV